ncbi:hypothetical protein MDA_GLEAN10024599 [Myotis davidii]|uniref:Uncharacterized protein n=1 Tax=Myotis davidii TaxID=225400 RepID=L5LJW0_MYODS|nr:hypothetical protein MDA_GLEAN10024599 [Myotis davidii]
MLPDSQGRPPVSGGRGGPRHHGPGGNRTQPSRTVPGPASIRPLLRFSQVPSDLPTPAISLPRRKSCGSLGNNSRNSLLAGNAAENQRLAHHFQPTSIEGNRKCVSAARLF